MDVGGLSWDIHLCSSASSKLAHAFTGHSQAARARGSAIFQYFLIVLFPNFHWSKQVTWPHQTSVWEGSPPEVGYRKEGLSGRYCCNDVLGTLHKSVSNCEESYCKFKNTE